MCKAISFRSLYIERNGRDEIIGFLPHAHPQNLWLCVRSACAKMFFVPMSPTKPNKPSHTHRHIKNNVIATKNHATSTGKQQPPSPTSSSSTYVYLPAVAPPLADATCGSWSSIHPEVAAPPTSSSRFRRDDDNENSAVMLLLAAAGVVAVVVVDRAVAVVGQQKDETDVVIIIIIMPHKAANSTGCLRRSILIVVSSNFSEPINRRCTLPATFSFSFRILLFDVCVDFPVSLFYYCYLTPALP
jgi:hypothetical protein